MIRLEKVQGIYCTDILDQPRALRDTVEGLIPLGRLDAVRDDLRTRGRSRIVLTGMGGSYQILHPLHLRLIEAGFDSIMVETSELLHSMPKLLSPTNVMIVVSQSGASAEIVRLMDHQESFYIGVSNTPVSPLATRSQITVLTRAGEEGGVSCKTAVTSLAALYWLGEHLTRADSTAARQVLETAAPAAEAYLSQWRDHVDFLVGALAGVKRVFFAGRGSSLAAVGLGAMVQKEAAHFHAEGMSSAALRHGPFEMLGPESFVVVFEGADNVRELNRRLVSDVLDTGAKASLCGVGTLEGPFALPPIHEAMRPILELLPAQMMSLALGYLQGREPGKLERITKVTTVE
ncbi:MAG TPA: SIS domain-containing protein [Bryobacteraceae bacterium]|nr:SIS domain-containing protein [Bryobacteraceae bacterium]